MTTTEDDLFAQADLAREEEIAQREREHQRNAHLWAPIVAHYRNMSLEQLEDELFSPSYDRATGRTSVDTKAMARDLNAIVEELNEQGKLDSRQYVILQNIARDVHNMRAMWGT